MSQIALRKTRCRSTIPREFSSHHSFDERCLRDLASFGVSRITVLAVTQVQAKLGSRRCTDGTQDE
jgi:hypothetical protein